MECEDTSEARISLARDNIQRRLKHRDHVVGELSDVKLSLYKAVLFAELNDPRVFVLPNFRIEILMDESRGLLLEHDFGFLGWNVPQLCEMMIQMRLRMIASYDLHCDWTRTLARGVFDSKFQEWDFKTKDVVQDMIHEQLIRLAQN